MLLLTPLGGVTCKSMQNKKTKFIGKVTCFKKLCNFKKPLSFITIGKLVPRLLVMFSFPHDIYQIIIDCLFPIVITCVLNQSRGHWLLKDALHVAITMNLKLKEEICNLHSPIILDNLMVIDSRVDIELKSFAMNMKKKVCRLIILFCPP